ncbi:MAG: hypothetical protein ABW170_14850 [Candidatus Thiodiazotropha sp. L084R]
MTRTAGALIGRRRSSAFWGFGCPKTHHEIKDSLVLQGLLIFDPAILHSPLQPLRIGEASQWQGRTDQVHQT